MLFREIISAYSENHTKNSAVHVGFLVYEVALFISEYFLSPLRIIILPNSFIYYPGPIQCTQFRHKYQRTYSHPTTRIQKSCEERKVTFDRLETSVRVLPDLDLGSMLKRPSLERSRPFCATDHNRETYIYRTCLLVFSLRNANGYWYVEAVRHV
jgi:hypothetical protein